MIEEIIGILFSILSMFISEPPRMSLRGSTSVNWNPGEVESEESERDLLWSDTIHREYEENGRQQHAELIYNVTSTKYTSLDSEFKFTPSFCQSVLRSLQLNISLFAAVFPLGLLAISCLYLDLNSSYLCFEWQHHNNTVPFAIMRWKLIGEHIEDIFLNLWFPVSLVMLFGWKDFKANYISTLYVGLAVSAVVVIYNTHLLVFGVFGSKDLYRYPGLALSFVGMIISCILLARKIRNIRPSVSFSRFQIITIISLNFASALAIAAVFKYAIVPYFDKLENEIYKAVITASTTLVTCIPTGLSKYFVLKRSSEIIHPERSFILVYFLRAGAIVVYRIAQADFKNRWIFIGLSLLHCFANLGAKATEKLREKLWTRFINFLRSTSCCQMPEEIQYDTPHRRRLNADLEVQNILFEYTTLLLGQGYFLLYSITSFEVAVLPMLKESSIRIFIGMGIDFVFNLLTVFIQLHWYDIPVRRVWLKHWKRHMLANIIILLMITSYFTVILLGVFQGQLDDGQKQLVLKNCSLPFSGY